MEVQQMLADQVRRRTSTEKAKDGLVITAAWYGANDDPDNQLDVRIPLQAAINNSQLIIPAGRSKSGLLGFFDCCPGQAKVLRIRYEFGPGPRVHEASYADRDAVTLPLRLHVLE
jgi:DnaJ family protein C protein 11